MAIQHQDYQIRLLAAMTIEKMWSEVAGNDFRTALG